MSRTGIEAKLPWQSLPEALRQRVASALDAPVLRAARVWGGYSPTPTYRLLLADGRRAFFKGVYQLPDTFAYRAFQMEELVYRDLGTLLMQWTPQLYANFQYGDWRVLLLEDLGPKSVPPWTPGKTRTITQALAAFHQSSLQVEHPAWLSRPDARLQRESWTQTIRESLELQKVAALAAEDAPAALQWFQHASDKIAYLMENSALREEPYVILHRDIRSDNLRLVRGKLYLFDWPAIAVGRPEEDVVAFAQSVTVEGGSAPEQILAWYEEKFPLRPAAIDGAIAWWLNFFAARAWQPEIPGLPRLRRFQCQQLGVLVGWAARRWSLAEPRWVEQLLE